VISRGLVASQVYVLVTMRRCIPELCVCTRMYVHMYGTMKVGRRTRRAEFRIFRPMPDLPTPWSSKFVETTYQAKLATALGALEIASNFGTCRANSVLTKLVAACPVLVALLDHAHIR
jgi:hypothetical protein